MALMTIAKAKEIIGNIICYQHSASPNKEGDALKLSIHALTRHDNRASSTFAGMMEPLPGETKD